MERDRLADLAAFVAVAQERSFTRAAGRLGITQSSLSHTIRRLEARLGLRLLARTTRSVAPTDAGSQLLRTLQPAFEDIDAGLSSLGELRDKPSGSVRITTAEHAANAILIPALERLLTRFPDIRVEIAIDYGLTDVVAERFDAGVRLGEQVGKGMVAVRIGPDMRMAAVATPAYFTSHRPPRVPQDLSHHKCINLRLPTSGGFYAWEFEKSGRQIKVRVDGQLACNELALTIHAAKSGLGIAYVPEDSVRSEIATGQLTRALADWCAPFSGYHLYYPSRRQPTAAFAALVEALRYRGPRLSGSGRTSAR
jgi:DNA-binding transcriptional LysR family regulator